MTDSFNAAVAAASGFLFQDAFLFVLLGTGVAFTFWSGFCQYRALTHGGAVLRGLYDRAKDPGAINHFQALSTALSATVGLGNIGGVAIAVALGGPGAIFWMWVVGLVGMALKLTEVTLSMLYRNIDASGAPHGGPMWVVAKGLAELNPRWAGVGRAAGWVFCVTLLAYTVSAVMFQSWNVGDITQTYFGVPAWVSGAALAILVGLVIIGGIKRIGAVASRLVPGMIVLYLLGGCVVLAVHWPSIPGAIKLIFVSAFNPSEASGAFLGGAVGYALVVGMRRALFSSEAGNGSSPIVHAAAKTDEPAREGVVGGLEPFIDTIVVCTFTALVILVSGVWERDGAARYERPPALAQAGAPGLWTLPAGPLPALRDGAAAWRDGEHIFVILEGDPNPDTGNRLHKLNGKVAVADGGNQVSYDVIAMAVKPALRDGAIYRDYAGATLTAKAFDSAWPGLGKWLVTMACWLFALSTAISWSYYGEQGVVFMFGGKGVMGYRFLLCLLLVVATMGIMETSEELDYFSSLGNGLMLWANLPIMIGFGWKAMRAYKDYVRRLKSGAMARNPQAPPFFRGVLTGKDVE